MFPVSSGASSPAKHILIVDDEPDIRQMLGEFLRQIGYQVSAVETGRQALDLSAQAETRFDAALVDWTLPGIDGPDVMSQIREHQPACRIFAITGHADQVVSGSAVGALVLEVFRKPFSLRALAKRLEEHLDA